MARADDDSEREWAEFRFGVISALVCGEYTKEEKELIRKGILAKAHLAPDGSRWQISQRTLRSWVRAYNASGLSGLYSKRRSTRNQFKAIPAEVLEAAVELRRELRTRSISQILHLLKMAGYDVTKVSKTTLNSHLNRLGVRKEKPYTDQGAYGSFEKKHINTLWQTDTSDGIWLPDPSGAKAVKLTYLFTFIDDCSRLLLHGQYYWSEQLPNLLDCFKKAVTKRGFCQKIYSDRGSIFRSRQWKSVCAELGIRQIFAQEASGKGKQERHYLTIQRGFGSEAQLSGLQTIEELNEFFDAWIDERYHKEVHRTLKQSPLERWQEEEATIKRIAPEKLMDALKLRANRDVNFKTARIQLNGKEYQASKHLGGEKVQLKWEFDRTDEIEIWREGDFVETARLFVRQENIDYSKRPERDEGPDKRKYVLESSKKYRLAMVSKRRGKAVEDGPNGLLSESEFTMLIETNLSRSLSESEQALGKRCYRANYPLRRDFIETVLKRCVKEKGANLHINIYLRRIEENNRNQR